jgi:hypothetical protein
MLRTMMEHRKIELENEATKAQVAANEAAYADALKAHAQAKVQHEQDDAIRAEKQAARARDAATGGLALVDATGQPYTQVETPSEPEAVPASA